MAGFFEGYRLLIFCFNDYRFSVQRLPIFCLNLYVLTP